MRLIDVSAYSAGMRCPDRQTNPGSSLMTRASSGRRSSAAPRSPPPGRTLRGAAWLEVRRSTRGGRAPPRAGRGAEVAGAARRGVRAGRRCGDVRPPHRGLDDEHRELGCEPCRQDRHRPEHDGRTLDRGRAGRRRRPDPRDERHHDGEAGHDQQQQVALAERRARPWSNAAQYDVSRRHRGCTRPTAPTRSPAPTAGSHDDTTSSGDPRRHRGRARVGGTRSSSRPAGAPARRAALHRERGADRQPGRDRPARDGPARGTAAPRERPRRERDGSAVARDPGRRPEHRAARRDEHCRQDRAVARP